MRRVTDERVRLARRPGSYGSMTAPGTTATAALGFRLHTGWAALVVRTGPPGKLEVWLRRRIELLPPGDSIPRLAYPQAAELPSFQAAELVRRARIASQEAALLALNDALDHLRPRNLSVKAAGIPWGSRPEPTDLAATLRSRPLIHTADPHRRSCFVPARGHYRVSGSGVGSHFGPRAGGLAESRRRVEVQGSTTRPASRGFRQIRGCPLGTDQKTAAAFALLALRSTR
jgi:hypothetical protein